MRSPWRSVTLRCEAERCRGSSGTRSAAVGRSARDVLYAHDVDRVEILCDRPLSLQADGEDMGDVTEALVEAKRNAVTVLV
jgi:hypothetical protein